MVPLMPNHHPTGDDVLRAIRPAYHAVACPNATLTEFADHPTSALWIGGGGTVVVTMESGADITFAAVPTGTRLDLSVVALKAASTATNVVALINK